MSKPDSSNCSRCGAARGRDLGDGVCVACLLEDALPAAEGFAEPVTEHTFETDPPTPRRFGAYELLEEIGRGGMGVIYKARQPGLDRLVALKMLLAGEFADPKARERLLREAKIAARLAHPRIVAIHEVGEHAGRPFFVMEYVSGRNLAQHCRDGLMPVATAASHVEQLARAVHYAHQRGVIHRDLKPANVMIGPDDQPKLTDFGLTKSLVDPTRTIERAGSPNFMAPEQADSTLGGTGALTDVFGLGAILYYLLAGRPPASGETLTETLRAVVTCEPIPPRRLRPALPRDLETIALRCLEKDPSRRYGGALELADELARWRNHEPIRARPATKGERLVKWIRRRPIVAALSAACAFTVLFGVAGITWQWRRAEAEKARAETEERRSRWSTIPPPRGFRPVEAVTADVNGDGRADVVTALMEDGAVAVLLGQPKGGLAPAPGSPFAGPRVQTDDDIDGAVAVGDLDGDGKPDLAIANQASDSLMLFRGDGSGGFKPLDRQLLTGRSPRTVRITDFNGDGLNDIVAVNFRGNSVSVFLARAGGGFAEAKGSPFAAGPAPWGLAVADFNEDGHPDLAVANADASTVSVFINQGDGRFLPAKNSPFNVGTLAAAPPGSNPFDVTTADVNRDGHADLMSADTRTDTITVLLGDGRGNFTLGRGSPIKVGVELPLKVVTGDFNRDGWPDLAVVNAVGAVAVLAGDGAGGFAPFTGSPVFLPGLARGLTVGDLDGDGAPDLVGCGPGFGVCVILNSELARRLR